MVSVDPSHLAARVTPFGVGVNAPNVEVPKFGEYLLTAQAMGRGTGRTELQRRTVGPRSARISQICPFGVWASRRLVRHGDTSFS